METYTILPIRCTGCNRVLAVRAARYEERYKEALSELQPGESLHPELIGNLLDDVNIMNPCCRIITINAVEQIYDLIDPSVIDNLPGAGISVSRFNKLNLSRQKETSTASPLMTLQHSSGFGTSMDIPPGLPQIGSIPGMPSPSATSPSSVTRIGFEPRHYIPTAPEREESIPPPKIVRVYRAR